MSLFKLKSKLPGVVKSGVVTRHVSQITKSVSGQAGEFLQDFNFLEADVTNYMEDRQPWPPAINQSGHTSLHSGAAWDRYRREEVTTPELWFSAEMSFIFAVSATRSNS